MCDYKCDCIFMANEGYGESSRSTILYTIRPLWHVSIFLSLIVVCACPQFELDQCLLPVDVNLSLYLACRPL